MCQLLVLLEDSIKITILQLEVIYHHLLSSNSICFAYSCVPKANGKDC